MRVEPSWWDWCLYKKSHRRTFQHTLSLPLLSPRSPLPLHCMNTQQESSCRKNSKWVLTSNQTGQDLELGLLASRMWEINVLLFKLPSLWYFVTIAQAKTHGQAIGPFGSQAIRKSGPPHCGPHVTAHLAGLWHRPTTIAQKTLLPALCVCGWVFFSCVSFLSLP